MNPDLYKNMIERLQWEMDNRQWLEEYCDGKMSDEDERKVMDCYDAVYNSLNHLSRKAKYQCEMFDKKVKGKKKKVQENAPCKKEEATVLLAVCILNKGYEDQFEEGVEYIVKRPSKNGTLMLVENMYGEDVTMLPERFEMVNKETV